jgi:hypothetical protein
MSMAMIGRASVTEAPRPPPVGGCIRTRKGDPAWPACCDVLQVTRHPVCTQKAAPLIERQMTFAGEDRHVVAHFDKGHFD